MRENSTNKNLSNVKFCERPFRLFNIGDIALKNLSIVRLWKIISTSEDFSLREHKRHKNQSTVRFCSIVRGIKIEGRHKMQVSLIAR